MIDAVDDYRDPLSLGNAAFSRIDHCDMMVAEVYKIALPSGKPLILKICRGDEDFHRELYFLKALAGFLPVPRVESVVEPTAQRAGAIVMGCILPHNVITHTQGDGLCDHTSRGRGL